MDPVYSRWLDLVLLPDPQPWTYPQVHGSTDATSRDGVLDT